MGNWRSSNFCMGNRRFVLFVFFFFEKKMFSLVSKKDNYPNQADLHKKQKNLSENIRTSSCKKVEILVQIPYGKSAKFKFFKGNRHPTVIPYKSTSDFELTFNE